MLNKTDMEKAVSCMEMMDAIEEAFRLYTANAYAMSDRVSLVHDGKTMIYMPCYAAGSFGTKILAEWPNNPEKGLPYLSGLAMLNNEENGRTDVIMDGTTLTALRTGAVGGVALRHLSDAGVATAGLIGCGVQGLHQLCYATAVRNIEIAYLFDPLKTDLGPFIAALGKMIAPKTVECVVCSDVESLLRGSGVVYTATQATSPVLPDDPALLEGKVVIAIGSWTPTMRELPDALWRVAGEVYVELPFACEESGDLAQPLASGVLTMDRVRLMGEFLKEKEAGGRRDLGSTRVYKSVGMAIFDTLAARRMHAAAVKKGLGQEVVW